MGEKKDDDEPRIEISVRWAGTPPEGVPSKVVLKMSDFEKIAELKKKLDASIEAEAVKGR